MSFTVSRHLGGTATAGPAASGSTYVSRTQRAAHTQCWMELAAFDAFPTVPSLAGTRVQSLGGDRTATRRALKDSLTVSTKGAGPPLFSEPVRLQFELFDDECPQTAANFRRLCGEDDQATGAASTVRSTVPAGRGGDMFFYEEIAPSYRGTVFHKIIPGFCVQGGDITMRLLPTTTGAATYRSSNHFNGSGRRGPLPDESKRRRHNEVGLLSMANTGPNTAGTQFFITTSDANECALNGRHSVFGRVVSGLPELMAQVAPFGDKRGRPSRYVIVVDCGTGALPEDGTVLPSETADSTSDLAASVQAPPEDRSDSATPVQETARAPPPVATPAAARPLGQTSGSAADAEAPHHSSSSRDEGNTGATGSTPSVAAAPAPAAAVALYSTDAVRGTPPLSTPSRAADGADEDAVSRADAAYHAASADSTDAQPLVAEREGRVKASIVACEDADTASGGASAHVASPRDASVPLKSSFKRSDSARSATAKKRVTLQM